MSRTLRCSLLVATMFSCTLLAQEQRWFEVEMLIFSQTPSALQEQFGDTVTPIKPGRAIDLLTPLYQPDLTALLDALPLCQPDFSGIIADRFNLNLPKQLCIFELQPHSWQQRSLFEPRHAVTTVPYPDRLPNLITGDGKHIQQPYLAELSSLQLTDIANKIKRQSGNSLLLHTSWRQAPVTERRAIASRWYGGSNFSQQFDYWGQPQTATLTRAGANAADTALLNGQSVMQRPADNNTALISNIDALLQQLNANSQLTTNTQAPVNSVTAENNLTVRNLPQQVWQLDGLFKLHLDHYLFVNTEFNLRRVSGNKLETIYVRQSRRVISGEIHYLDHPHLGIVLQIRRFDPASQDISTPDIDSNLITE